jgi:tetratricopeptide (TPR) repeat protein
MNRTGYYYNSIAAVNKENRYGLKFAVTNEVLDLTLEDAYRQITIADSTIGNQYGIAVGNFYKGIINGMVQNFKTAIEQYDQALIMDSTLVFAYINRALASAEMEEHQFMQRKYASSVTISWGENEPEEIEEMPDNPDYMIAIAFLTMAIQLDPENPFAYFNRANLKNKSRDYSGAVQDYSKAIERLDSFKEAYYNRALTLLVMKDKNNACKDLSKAGELGMQDAYRVIKRYCRKK